MKKVFKIMANMLAIAAFAAVMGSCTRGSNNGLDDDDDDDDPKTGQTPDNPGNPITHGTPPQGTGLYIAGYYTNKTYYTACYWKINGQTSVQKDLSNTENRYEANGIAVSKNGVYIAGTYGSSIERKACYWLDDGKTIVKHDLPLPSGTKGVTLHDITVNENGVYIAGEYSGGSDYKPCYWDNKRAVHILPLPAAAETSRATGIGVASNGKIYISGYYETVSRWAACYWTVDGTNIERKDLYSKTKYMNNSEDDSYALALTVTSTGIYISGYYISTYYNDGFRPCYWCIKEGSDTRYDLSGKGEANAIAVNAGGVYAAGSYDKSSGYWDASGKGYKLQGTYRVDALAVSSTGEVHVAGVYDRDGHPNATYWNPQGTGFYLINDNIYSYNLYSYAEAMVLVE
jgi:hypothetical protein